MPWVVDSPHRLKDGQLGMEPRGGDIGGDGEVVRVDIVERAVEQRERLPIGRTVDDAPRDGAHLEGHAVARDGRQHRVAESARAVERGSKRVSMSERMEHGEGKQGGP